MLTLDEQDTMLDETAALHVRCGMSPEILKKKKRERPFNFANVLAPISLGFTRIKQSDGFRMGELGHLYRLRSCTRTRSILE